MSHTSDSRSSGHGTLLHAEDAIPMRMPPLAALSEQQTCGRACVWCAVALGTGTPVDLGERCAEDGRHWFPRSCQLCVIKHVYPAQLDHTQNCEQCTDDPTLCGHGTWLRLVMRQARR
ncbi:hypothetical protein [Streptomyces sp. NPDC017964]|uniref:hypothetical protein n=1 Tax=Streptomyces sp. NPDC017964 TaxID=3365022 RepID=UPI003791437B